MTEIHTGGFGNNKTPRFDPYLVEQVDDNMWCVGIRPGDISSLQCWCEDMIGMEGEEWGCDSDEFYSQMSSGNMFWFSSETDFTLFRMAWCLS